MSSALRHLVAIAASLALAGPAVLDACVISCHATEQAGSSAVSSPHCHRPARSPLGTIVHGSSTCDHDHTASVVESTAQRRHETSVKTLNAVSVDGVIGELGTSWHELSTARDFPAPGIDSAAFAVPLRI